MLTINYLAAILGGRFRKFVFLPTKAYRLSDSKKPKQHFG